MVLYREIAAMKAFYYLVAVDGDVQPVELQRLSQIGEALSPGRFTQFRKSMIDDCNANLSHAFDDTERLRIASSDAKRMLESCANDETGVNGKILLWDLIVIANCDGECSDVEKQYILNITEVLGLEASVVDEMQFLISAAVDIEKELEWAESLQLPFTEVREIVEALEERLEVLVSCARDLVIDDDLDWADGDDREKPREIESAYELFEGVATEVSKRVIIPSCNGARSRPSVRCSRCRHPLRASAPVPNRRHP